MLFSILTSAASEWGYEMETTLCQDTGQKIQPAVLVNSWPGLCWFVCGVGKRDTQCVYEQESTFDVTRDIRVGTEY